jgi:hypothetical protein
MSLASRHLSEGNLRSAIDACDRVLELDATNVTAELVKSEALLRFGHLERAIEGTVRVLAVDKRNTHAYSLFERGVTSRRRRNARLASIDRVAGESVVRCLGIGREGAVYLTRGQNADVHVAKIFHPHIVRDTTPHAYSWQGALTRIAAHLKERPGNAVDTLYPFDVLTVDGALHGIVYDHEPLKPVRKRHRVLPDVAPAIMSAFFRTQAYLCAHVDACLTDAHLANFMMASNGSLRFIDYGSASFASPGGSRGDQRPELFALVRLVYQLFKGIQLDPQRGCSVATSVEKAKGLADLAEKREWIQRVLSSIDAAAYGDFLSARYYSELAENLPRRIGFTSRTVISFSNTVGSTWRRMPRPFMKRHTVSANTSSTVIESIHP